MPNQTTPPSLQTAAFRFSLLWPAWVRLLLAALLSACLWLLLAWAEQA